MRLYHKENAGEIWHGDCIELMKTMPEKSVDLILTDPPYSLPNNQFRPEARMSQRTWGEFSPWITWFKIFISDAKRILSDNGNILVFCDETFYPVIYPILYSEFYATKMLIWNKGRIGMGGIWRRKFEIITHSYLRPKSEKSGDSDILEFSPVRDKLHNSQKPIELLKFIIEKCNPKNVLDPFLGSGTTAIACKELNKKFIGCEIEEKYCEIAKKRLEQEVLF